ncbi:MAG: G-D-S-L family lipolytic protein [Sphingobacteriales bacterium]|nr:MAG: G-D-S-L family lipolytic protein [Sphingobacteriales bacterium]
MHQLLTIVRSSFLAVLLSLLTTAPLRAQTAPPFWKEIVAFKRLDSAQRAPGNPILFIGSSSFTRWAGLEQSFSGYPVLNRAFGGSTLPDLIRYSYDIILPYRPRQVFVYCGENDLASSDSISADEVLRRTETLFNIIRTNLPDAQFCYVSIKPSPVRAAIQPKVREANRLIRKFIRRKKNAVFINIYDAMLDANGNMREELYVADRLHMTAEGYTIWQGILLPYLAARP